MKFCLLLSLLLTAAVVHASSSEYADLGFHRFTPQVDLSVYDSIPPGKIQVEYTQIQDGIEFTSKYFIEDPYYEEPTTQLSGKALSSGTSILNEEEEEQEEPPRPSDVESILPPDNSTGSSFSASGTNYRGYSWSGTWRWVGPNNGHYGSHNSWVNDSWSTSYNGGGGSGGGFRQN